MRVLLDCMEFDLLEKDVEAREKIRELCNQGKLEIIVTPKLIKELSGGPLRGVPDWFPITYRKESVVVSGHAFLGHGFLRKGEIYSKHRGDSEQEVPDAILAESANVYADVFVSEEKRARNRLSKFSVRCKGMTFTEFSSEILGLKST